MEWAILVKNVDRMLNIGRSVIYKVEINICFKRHRKSKNKYVQYKKDKCNPGHAMAML